MDTQNATAITALLEYFGTRGLSISGTSQLIVARVRALTAYKHLMEAQNKWPIAAPHESYQHLITGFDQAMRVL